MILSPDACAMLLPVILDTHQYVRKAIKELILNQTSFKSDKLRKSLYAATYMKVSRFRSKYIADSSALKMSDQDKQAALMVLQELEGLKKQAFQLSQAEKQLQKSVAIISSFDLLYCMFSIVMVNMHQKVWGPVGLSDR